MLIQKKFSEFTLLTQFKLNHYSSGIRNMKIDWVKWNDYWGCFL